MTEHPPDHVHNAAIRAKYAETRTFIASALTHAGPWRY